MDKELIYLGEEKDLTIEGVNPFDGVDKQAVFVRDIYVKDPLYGKRHKAGMYRILNSETLYAVAEFSVGVYGVYMVKQRSLPSKNKI